ncbi:hypothetical protein [Vandammella animalimorsus]|uniref:Uncharacterized protein n=1 Tax=Vandammella animalimorsus TaxID=2029117 RepID=A0A2A2AW51_9BURK|nr:hypothetical protein [Vandammella animalimorsus]PAT41993.1 hypothetical protein CK621_11785 [Vandammella animalimorsus]RRD44817.1 hypothetical protein EII18_00245 [Comamonadaceae bacterium OH3737_COT-264]
MNANTSIPATQNEGWGFWGTMGGHASTAWPLAMHTIADTTGQDLDSVRAFLDSRYGRHFADEVHNAVYTGQPLPQAITSATQKWMAFSTDRSSYKGLGIPVGLAYLTGLVVHCAIFEEMNA